MYKLFSIDSDIKQEDEVENPGCNRVYTMESTQISLSIVINI